MLIDQCELTGRCSITTTTRVNEWLRRENKSAYMQYAHIRERKTKKLWVSECVRSEKARECERWGKEGGGEEHHTIHSDKIQKQQKRIADCSLMVLHNARIYYISLTHAIITSHRHHCAAAKHHYNDYTHTNTAIIFYYYYTVYPLFYSLFQFSFSICNCGRPISRSNFGKNIRRL